MMSLTEQLGLIEAENARLKAEAETLKTRLAKNAGALDESRAQNRQLIARNELLARRVAYLEKHFYDFHGSAAEIERQRKDIAAQVKEGATTAEIINSPAQVETIKSRIARIIKRDEVATNGQANGSGVH